MDAHIFRIVHSESYKPMTSVNGSSALKKRTFTYSDYAKLPEGAPYQLIEGELIMTPSPIPYHQEVSKKIEFKLFEYVELNNRLGKVYDAPIDIYLDEKEVYQPDLVYISTDRLGIVKEDKIEGAPDLVIEILSPSTAYYDLRYKKNIYGRFGVREYWIVDIIEKTVEIYENKENKFVLAETATGKGKIRSKLISGFEIELEKIF